MITLKRDIGYIDDNGYLFYEGRNDDMMNVGARMISPLEIENELKKIGGIKKWKS